MNSKRPGHLHQNRHGVFYFRRAIPATLSAHFAQREIYRSLRTTNRGNAIIRSQAFGLVTDLLFRKLRAMAKNKNDISIQADLTLEMDLDGLGTVRVDMEPHEIETGKAVISHAVESLAALLGKGNTSKLAVPSKLLTVAIDEYLGELENSGHRPESVLDYRGDFNQFIQIIGDVPVAGLQHEVLNDFKKKLTGLPPNINKTKELRDKSIDEILAMQLPPQSAVTVRKKWSRFQAFLEWAVGQGYTDKNYAKGKKPKASSKSREKFNDDGLGHAMAGSIKWQALRNDRNSGESHVDAGCAGGAYSMPALSC
ncbi:MAG: hypothetical protein Q8L40_11015 [Burkholderiales bacterium]|nr:hypothetical protein [Burkholderiales bacterium]